MIPTRRKSADVKSTFIQSKILETFEPDMCGRLQLESGCISTDMWQLYDRLSGLETHVSMESSAASILFVWGNHF